MAFPGFDLNVTFVGVFSLADATGEDLCPRGQKPKALLSYILYNAGHKLSRNKLIAMFWADRGEKQGRDSFRQALHQIRMHLGEHAEGLLDIDRHSVMARKEALSADIWQASGYRWDICGPFLEELGMVSAEFENWVAETSREVRKLQIMSAEQYLLGLDPHANADDIVGCCDAILALDPHNEAAARTAMKLHAQHGNRSHAMRVFECLSTSLHYDGLAVSPETSDLVTAIISNSYPAQRPTAQLNTGLSGLTCGLPRLRIEQSDLYQLSDHIAIVSDFVDHLILRVVQMPELKFSAADGTMDDSVYVVDVSTGLTRAGLRISLRLRSPDNQYIWSGRIDVSPSAGDEFVRLSADKFVMQLLPALEKHYFFELEAHIDTAYGLYVRARRIFWTNPEAGYIEQVLELLQKAIEIDPDFLPPYDMLVMHYNTGMFMSRPGIAHDTYRAKAYNLSQNMLFRNSKYANGHIAMGWCQLWRGNFNAAERSIRRAMELGPYEPHRLNVVGTALVYLGYHEEGQAYYDTAQDRILHDFDFQRTDYGELFFLMKRFQEALSWMEFPETRTPYKTYYFRAMTHANLGRIQDARDDLDAFIEDMRSRWAGTTAFSPELGFQWYTDMLPLRSDSDRDTIKSSLQCLGFSVLIPPKT